MPGESIIGINHDVNRLRNLTFRSGYNIEVMGMFKTSNHNRIIELPYLQQASPLLNSIRPPASSSSAHLQQRECSISHSALLKQS